jgi:phosphomannomutase
MDDVYAIPAVGDRLRDQPPTSLGGLAVVLVDDLSLGSVHVPPTSGLRFRLADDGRVVVRPSGTGPKIRCYLEVVVPVESDQDDAVDAARINAVGRLDAIRGDLQAAAGI